MSSGFNFLMSRVSASGDFAGQHGAPAGPDAAVGQRFGDVDTVEAGVVRPRAIEIG